MASRLYFLCFIWLIVSPRNTAHAQGSLGTWNILSVKYSLNDRWNFLAEGQVRSLAFYSNFHYHEGKVVASYTINSGLRAGIGFGKSDTYNEKGDFQLPKNNSEFRLWPQIILSHKQGKIGFEHRYRAELRFAPDNFRFRFRYRFGIHYSFFSQKKERDSIKVGLSNELFFSPYEPYFERNRLLFSVDYPFNQTITLHAGYLHQFDYKIFDEIGRDFLQVGCFLSLGH
ncbi:MAG: DUF2490 domain-containing protein [Flavobacteriales bacterium]